MATLVLITNELVKNPDAVAAVKSEYPGEVHTQLVERFDEHAVQIKSKGFEKVVVRAPEGHLVPITSACSDAIFKTLTDSGSLSGQIDDKSSNSTLILTGFVHNGDRWSKIKAGGTQILQRPKGSSAKKSMFKRASEQIEGLSINDEDLIDEDDLVGDIRPAIKFPPKCDPGPGRKRRKACKDCTCGLKELEEQEIAETTNRRVMLSAEDITEIDFTVPGKAVGGCGSCALGDAFRCDGCPYLGLPPFKPGEVVSVDQFGDDF